jgi:regulatory protein
MPGPENECERALAFALAYLNRGDRTVVEVRRRLDRSGHDAAAVEHTVATLVEQGYLDDARFASLFAHDKRELEEWGVERIRHALYKRGIDRDLVRDALATATADDEHERALALLRRRFPSVPRGARERDRALGVLVRRGFESQLALDALAAYAAGANAPEECFE